MGIVIHKERFDAEDRSRFQTRLQENLEALRLLLDRSDFGQGETSLGAELEVSVVDAAFRARPLERRQLAKLLDPNMQFELDRFNLEYNLLPVGSRGTPFRKLQEQMQAALHALDQVAAKYGARAVPIGILPTLTEHDLSPEALTDLPRYRALSTAIRELRQAPFEVCIDGQDPLRIECDDVTLEGASTSLQLHLRVCPAEFAATYNAAQLATPVALAVSGNAPTFLGHRLWEETRIALFKQAVDSRGHHDWGIRPPCRVSFGHGWVRDGAYELFAETVALFPPLLPISSEEDALLTLEQGRLPKLQELRLHHGTVWRWNRAVYDTADNGHLRIELRALPSGPTPLDMAANAAFLLGLTRGLQTKLETLLHALPFDYAQHNFYRAAQQGLEAELLWPTGRAPSPRPVGACELAHALLPLAETGLAQLGVVTQEIDHMLGTIRERLEAGTTPARWQRRMLHRLETDQRLDRPTALARVLERYLQEAATGRPVHVWSERA